MGPQPGTDGPHTGDGGDRPAGPVGGVRAALGGLTTRGRSFLAAGLAAGGCAYALGQADLLRVGLLLAVLPLVCALALLRTRHRVTGGRRLTPVRVPVGAEARVRLRVSNVGRLPTGLLLLQDRVPYALGARPRFVLDRVAPGAVREVSYRVRSELRGRHPLGPLELRLADPFGMCEIVRRFPGRDTLTVVPRVEALPPVRPGGSGPGTGGGRPRPSALSGEDDVIPRGYRHGDDLRRVHWRSTARHGELMVRREEQPRRTRCTVLLDTRAVAHEGSGPGSAFEWAVSGAASVLLHLLERGLSVRLLTDAGTSVPGPEGVAGRAGYGHGPSDAAGLFLDTLAVLGPGDGPGLGPAHEALRGAGEGLLVAFFGALDAGGAAVAARMRRHSGAAVAFVLDPAAWASAGTDGTREQWLRDLREAGWTALPVAPGASLPELWQRAATDGHAPPERDAAWRTGPAAPGSTRERHGGRGW
ncbi:DUF58 domain-containing protein [Streptomyces gamaensis]|uniref:DUF58 domain-containing protein n=1 Tax=Streptomyces gamaensis TaxID=1763542 RepID=A0ABW0Z6P9_9ACTN